MKNPRKMPTADIYRHLELRLNCTASRADHLAKLFYQAAMFLIHKIKYENWQWRNNYLREYARCALRASFTNIISPYINELMFRQHPGLRIYDAGPAD
jgi:hypothetical protein